MLPMSLADAFDRRQPKHCRLRSDAWQAAENSSARPGVGEPANAIAQISRSRTTETRNGGAGAARGAVNEARSARLLSPRTPPGVLDGTPLSPFLPSYPAIRDSSSVASPFPYHRSFSVFLVLRSRAFA